MTDDPVALARELDQIASDLMEDFRHEGGGYHATNIRNVARRLRALPVGVTVPLEPTPAMRTAWKNMPRGTNWYGRYKAMLAAVPASPTTKPTTEDELQAAGSGRGLG